MHGWAPSSSAGGATSFSSVAFFPFFSNGKGMTTFEYDFHIGQASPQLSSGDTCH